jgi:electron transport complex protein RnfC
MREKPEEIIAGIQIMMHIINTQQCLIGIEDNKPQAIAALQAAIASSGDTRIQAVPVPTLYPTGGEKQLIKILTGKEVPSGGRPASIGLVCHNAATARAIYRAVALGEPLIDRYVTVTGPGIAQPCNLNVPVGTPVQHLIEQAGGYTQAAQRLLMGGPMMGITLNNTHIPVVKATNCILVEQPKPVQPAMPCIRCGRCMEACPANLLPQQLYWYSRSREFDKAENLHLFDCIECGCCAYVCPSHIPLVDYYRFAKAEIRTQRDSKRKAEIARDRHEFRLERQERAKREKAEKLAKHKEQAQTSTDDGKKAAIQAALERAQAKKAAAQQDNPA